MIDQLKNKTDWEQKYSFLIEIGRGGPALGEKHKTDANLIRACQSKVWFVIEEEKPAAESEAIFINGALRLIMAAFEDNPDQAESRIQQTEILQSISGTRANGLKHIIDKLKLFYNEKSIL